MATRKNDGVSKIGGIRCQDCNLLTVTATRRKDGGIDYDCSNCGLSITAAKTNTGYIVQREEPDSEDKGA